MNEQTNERSVHSFPAQGKSSCMLCVFPVAVSSAFQKYSATFTLPTLTLYELFAWLKVINLFLGG